MHAVILVVHLMIAIALVGVILIQRSEGGGLGIGGGTMGGMTTARGAANLLTRTTAILAAVFMSTSIILAIMAGRPSQPTSIIDTLPAPAPAQQAPAVPAAPAPPVAR
ncbi:preprotein translocase subunit SecG [Azospirillum sp. TSO22-1]|uniref:preprotein translocase subunit SecG n=1 Tax=Azospirillum sp. TSO22-1 TaxID=716789 RepID=UPI000D61782B|nr:preprotein translocase subunit SecG [Azospirillum sp. TSO22-1]PWC55810.1 preprotein translocase subunit SecG [Azospirillum sp. TSO22-1]